MFVTKNAAELCVLLIDEFYGELPSRIFSVLLSKGRSTLQQLVQYTTLTPRQMRHGLAVLLQQNLLYYHADPDMKVTFYEANADHAYFLIRTGKVLEMVDSSFGPAAKDVMQSLLLLGQTRLFDLISAYQDKISKSIKSALEKEEATDELGDKIYASSGQGIENLDIVFKSSSELKSVLCRLAEAELIQVVHKRTCQSLEDIYKDVERDVLNKFPNGVKGAKGKSEFDDKVAASLRALREESMTLKRKLEHEGVSSTASAVKRRKLLNGNHEQHDRDDGRKPFKGVGAILNGNQEDQDADNEDPFRYVTLDHSLVIRVNYEKCDVELRNRRLVAYAAEMCGPTTAHIYGVLLRQLTKDISRCRPDLRVDSHGQKAPMFVTTMEILDHVKSGVDLSGGIGKPPKSEISRDAAEKIRKHRPVTDHMDTEANGEDDDDDDEDEDDADLDDDLDDEFDHGNVDSSPQVNGARESKVKFADAPGKEPRQNREAQLRQHLLLLAETRQQFVRHCGSQEWTVDFDGLLERMKKMELDTVVEQTSGRFGLRLAHILRDKGKLDEKMLPNIAFMTKKEVQRKLLEMETQGFVHVQEVPRDNKHDVKKSFFLWFCDVDKSLDLLLDKTYKAMLRSMQTLKVLRQKDKDVLMITKRSDVKGREQDVMRKEYFERYSRFLSMERKLLGQVHRLDDLVGVLRDFCF